MIPTYARLSDRHPFEIYLLVWALVSSAPAALGLTPLPDSLLRQADPWVARVWVTILTLACLIALIGLAWPRPKGLPIRLSVTGLILEQVGLVGLSAATVFYSAAIVLRGGIQVMPLVGIILGIGSASAVQSWKIQKVLRRSEGT